MYQELFTPPTFSQLRHTYPQVNTLMWDLDGTIANTEPLHMQAVWSVTQENYNSNTQDTAFSFEKLCEQSIGCDDENIFNQLQEKRIITETLDYTNFLQQKTTQFNQYLEKTYPNDISHLKIIKLLKQAKNNNFFRQALVTNSDRESCYEILSKLELTDAFDLIITLNDMEQAKPNPSGYLMAQKQLESRWEKTIIFEDSSAGLQAAKCTNSHIIKACWYH